MASTLDVLTDPKRFFSDAGEDPKARYPILILVVLSLVGTAFLGVFLFQVLQNTEGGSGFAVVATLFVLIGQLIGNFLVWLVYALVFFALSAFMDGEGDFMETLVFTGWGFIPRIAGAVVSGVISLIAITGVTPPDIDFENPAAAQQEMIRFATEAGAGELNLISSLAGIVFLFWSAYIWVAAVEDARELDRQQAMIAVGIPVGIALLLRLNSLIGAF